MIKCNFELWKDIEGYEGLYQVSTWGRIKNIKTGRISKTGKNRDGYLQVGLRKEEKQKKFLVHRLVAQTFIPNPLNLPQVNHKDEDPGNPRRDNLEWCTCKYNINYGNHTKKAAKTRSKPVYQYTLDGELVKIYPSVTEVSRNGFNGGNVSMCCRGIKSQFKGFYWSYEKKFKKHV